MSTKSLLIATIFYGIAFVFLQLPLDKKIPSYCTSEDKQTVSIPIQKKAQQAFPSPTLLPITKSFQKHDQFPAKKTSHARKRKGKIAVFLSMS
jgi:hypothetical protein